jgi:hypothetical protein
MLWTLAGAGLLAASMLILTLMVGSVALRT